MNAPTPETLNAYLDGLAWQHAAQSGRRATDWLQGELKRIRAEAVALRNDGDAGDYYAHKDYERGALLNLKGSGAFSGSALRTLKEAIEDASNVGD